MDLDRLEQTFDMYANMLGLIAGAVGIVFLGVQFKSKLLVWDGFIIFELFFLLLIFKWVKRSFLEYKLRKQKINKLKETQLNQ